MRVRLIEEQRKRWTANGAAREKQRRAEFRAQLARSESDALTALTKAQREERARRVDQNEGLLDRVSDALAKMGPS
jgi:hypothetical protein